MIKGVGKYDNTMQRSTREGGLVPNYRVLMAELRAGTRSYVEYNTVV